MTEWDACGYARISALQQAMATEVLALLKLNGSERVLDVGCGNGKVTAEIASRVPAGTVLGVDSSADMIASARHQFGPELRPNLSFEVAEARQLLFRHEFDLVVSFNALHWVSEQEQALRSIRSALKSSGTAQLRLVPAGQRKSLENVIEETRLSSRWASYYRGFSDPYLHLTPEQYRALAEQNGFHVERIHTEDKAWDFQSRLPSWPLGRLPSLNGLNFYPSLNASRSSVTSWIATGPWRPIDPATRIPSSSIRWISRFRRPKKTRHQTGHAKKASRVPT